MPIVCQNIVHGRPLHAYLPNLPKNLLCSSSCIFQKSHLTRRKKGTKKKGSVKTSKTGWFQWSNDELVATLVTKRCRRHKPYFRRPKSWTKSWTTKNIARKANILGLEDEKSSKKSTPSQNVKSFYDMLCVSAAWFSRWFMRIRHPPIVV